MNTIDPNFIPYRENELLDNNQKYPHIDFWEPTLEDMYVVPDGKTMVIFFNKIFTNTDYNATLNTFNVGRDSYANRLDDFASKDGTVDKGICHYINYFLKYYDEDKELLIAYLKIKYILDRKTKSNKPMKPKKFNKLLQQLLYTKNIINKVNELSEANYIVDLSQDPDDKKEYPKSLQFTNEHAKILMSISFMMKIASPVIYHYIGKLKDPSSIEVYLFYEPLFTLVGDPSINIWNKIFITALSKFNANLSNNKLMWSRIEIFGKGRDNAINNLIKEKLVSDNLFKYTYTKNIVNFNSVILEKQLRYYNRENFGLDLKEIIETGVPGTLSGKDKFEMASNKIDESLILLSRLNIKQTLKRLQEEFEVKISKEELAFYIENLVIDDFQSELLNYVFAKHFHGFSDLDLMTREDYVRLFIILKKHLINNREFEYLPDILTGTRVSKLNTRTIQNTKFISKIKESSMWKGLMKEKFSVLKHINKEDIILNLLSTILNTTFVYCDYDNPDINGQIIDYNKDVLSNELLNLLWFI